MGSGSATFTKWLIGEGPEMVGAAGGVVGDGTFSGRVLELEPGETTVIRAVYRLTGVVTDGWCKGHLVRGEYTQIQHDHDGTTTDAWQGSLDIVDATIDVRAGDLAHSG